MKDHTVKNTDERKLFRPSDMILIVILLAAPIIYFLAAEASGNNGTYAEISHDGEIIASVALDTDGVYSYPSAGEMEFTVADGGIRVSKSDCPDKVCMGAGKLCRVGDTAVCVPNRVVVTVHGERGGDVDGVVR